MAHLTVKGLQALAKEIGYSIEVSENKNLKYCLKGAFGEAITNKKTLAEIAEEIEELKSIDKRGLEIKAPINVLDLIETPVYDTQTFEEVEKNNQALIETEEAPSEMKLSKYQENIINWVKTGTGNGAVNAVAGSGKSTTLKLVAKELEATGVDPSDVRVIVFGKANSKDLIEKFGKQWGDSISTLHSAGLSILKSKIRAKKIDVSESKYKWIAKDLGYMRKYDKKQKTWINGALTEDNLIKNEQDFIRLINMCRLTLFEVSAESIQALASHFEITDIYDYRAIADAVADCLIEGEKRAKKGNIDYTDMIYLPVKWQIKIEPFKFVLIDECQDLNKAQLELSLMLAGETGRLLFVGDRRQAIMGFAGADCNSFQTIVDRVKATELALSICYRCPKSHIELVNKIYPEIPIESAPKAKEGAINKISENELDQLLKVNDMVLSRKTAPLITLCIKLIAKGIAATVKGKDIGTSIKKELEEISEMSGFTYPEFPVYLKHYKEAKIQRLEKLDNEALIEALNDKLEAIETIYTTRIEAQSIKELCDYIDSLFSDSESPITLSTAHRSKGLENERIFIIKPEDFPLTWKNQSDWQFEQEENLLYVALTRSKSELFIVNAPDWFVEEAETENEPAAPIVVYQRPRRHNQTQPIVNGVIIVESKAEKKQPQYVSATGNLIYVFENEAIVKSVEGKILDKYSIDLFERCKPLLKTYQQHLEDQEKLEALIVPKRNRQPKEIVIKAETSNKVKIKTKKAPTGKTALEIEMLRQGVTKEEILAALGWKSWSHSRSSALSYGYSIRRDEDKRYWLVEPETLG